MSHSHHFFKNHHSKKDYTLGASMVIFYALAYIAISPLIVGTAILETIVAPVIIPTTKQVYPLTNVLIGRSYRNL